ncbi:MAG: Rpn family recombination-promoting nuclease/putative transposase [Hormoscilla sp. GUM202]|nr:Rpn family recombination-promoting nuclease/putative transposase [Hormoscilla sp. GUM202]
MPRRVRAYTALAEEKYQIPVYPVLINILKRGENPAPIPTCYSSQFRNVRAYQDYRVINLWEVDVDLVFQQPLPSLLPFVPILKDGGKEATVRQALKLLREDEKLNEIEIWFFRKCTDSINSRCQRYRSALKNYRWTENCPNS